MRRTPRKRLLTFSIALSVAASSATASAQNAPAPTAPLICVGAVFNPDNGGSCCYGKAQLEKIATAIIELKTCRVNVAEKDALIAERLGDPNVYRPSTAWWQEPSMIVGGIVVSASFASFLTLYMVRKK